MVNGCDCLIGIKTQYREIVQSGEAELPGRNAAHFCGIPYAVETLREAVSLLKEEAAIEGDGICRAVRKSGGVTGCVVTPLTIGTAPLLLSLAMGGAEMPLYVSETRNLHRCVLNLLPVEDCSRFDLVQDRGGPRTLYEGCAVIGFELRINRGEPGRQAAVRLKLDIRGERPPVIYPYTDPLPREWGERFMGDRVGCRINGREYRNIYGLTLSTTKEGGTRTELRIKRALELGGDLPDLIEELTITAQLLRDKYEYRYFGMFRVTLTRLVLVSDETAVDCADGVIGPLRYYVAGTVSAEVFTNSGETLT
jgi:hypothetical protein